ncbi:hypothetical protein FC35_GL001089 [Limosilactobacillus coleohominis DSM 14060]|nr:hypothetical protein FC35_GL001089 [Limosilactobacillus coleohominis DSM 14060]
MNKILLPGAFMNIWDLKLFLAYEHMGFKVVSRSPIDDQGNPYPILKMNRVN